MSSFFFIQRVFEVLLSLKIVLLAEIVFVLPAIGIGQRFLSKSNLSIEAKIALSLTAGLVTVPFLCGAASVGLGIYNSVPLIISVSCLTGLALYKPIKRFFFRLKPPRPSANVLLFLTCLSGVGILYYYIHNCEELYFQLYSWIVKGDAKCFYLQMFKTLFLFQPIFLPEVEKSYLFFRPLTDVHPIICTPANVVLPSTMLVIFGRHGLQVLHALLAVQLAAFSYLTVEALTGRRLFSYISLFIAVLHPYLLDTVVLDRNFIALSFSSILLYLLVKNLGGPMLLGLLYGFISGLGLHFLPLGFIFPIAIAAIARKSLSIRWLFLFLSGFIITFSINLPHLAIYPPIPGAHGHSLSLQRTPYLPFPNAIFFPIHFIHYSGTIFTAAIALGLGVLFRRNRWAFLQFLSLILFVYFVLGTQSFWLEADKMRIGMTAYFPLFIAAALGLVGIVEAVRSGHVGPPLFLVLLTGLLHLAVGGSGCLDFKSESIYHDQDLLCARETQSYFRLLKDHFSSAPVGPNITRIKKRLNLRQRSKQIEQNENFLFSALPRHEEFFNLYLHMDLFPCAMNPERPAEPDKTKGDDSNVEIGINLNRLHEGGWIVTDTPEEGGAILDLTDPLNRSTLFYTESKVEWRPGTLPVGVKFERGPYLHPHEETVVIDLNCYKRREGTSNRVDVISRSEQGESTEASIPFRPCPTSDGRIFLRARPRQPIVIRNWLINPDNASIYRVDSFCLTWKDDLPHRTRFQYDWPSVYF